MKILLRSDIDNLGKKGDLVEVADGYARNYLVPRGFAIQATRGVQKQADEMQRARNGQDRRNLEKAQGILDQLAGRTIKVTARAGEEGRIFGSITAADVAAAVLDQCGLELDRRKIDLEEPIRSLGTHQVAVRLHADLDARLSVEVGAEE